MPAYIIVDIEITNPELYQEYIKLTPASLALYGGKFVVRGGPVEILEGNPNPGRMVVLEFKDAETARAWWASPEYGPAKEIRQQAANTKMILVEGYSPLL